MKVIYIHHANRKVVGKPCQQDDITELGKRDAELTGELLSGVKDKANIVAIFCSTFLRCTKTAKIINEKLNLPIILDERLNEFKSMENESWLDCQKRIRSVIDEIVEKYSDDECVICVTSGVNVAAFISKAYGFKSDNAAPMIGVPSCSPLVFEYKKEK